MVEVLVRKANQVDAKGNVYTERSLKKLAAKHEHYRYSPEDKALYARVSVLEDLEDDSTTA